jgi:NAD(P)-dependent dehydrogenase (short-subunit alcohol dehydrogenase family)
MSKVVLITGASRGIGAATARQSAAAGFDVAINYTRDEASAQAVADDVRAAGRQALVVRADVGSEKDIVGMFEAVDSELGTVTGLVNNTGILFQQMRLDEMDAERIERVLAVNVTGTILCCREAVRRMSTRHGGSGGAIVNVSSVASRIGGPNEYIDYAASKGAVDSITLGLSKEVATEGIRVNAVRPGIIDTEIHASGGEPGRAFRVAPNVPMQRPGDADEVAAAIVWLLSDEASYTSGALLDVAGAR